MLLRPSRSTEQLMAQASAAAQPVVYGDVSLARYRRLDAVPLHQFLLETNQGPNWFVTPLARPEDDGDNAFGAQQQQLLGEGTAEQAAAAAAAATPHIPSPPPATLPVYPPLQDFYMLRDSLQAEWQAARADGDYIAEVWICLCKSAPSRRPSFFRSLFRSTTELIAGEYTHVELAFKNNADAVMAWTVDFPDELKPHTGFVRQTPVNIRKQYPQPYWECYQISTLTGAEMMGLNMFCWRQNGKPMNSAGLYNNFLPLVGGWWVGEPQLEEDSYFCSQLVASALRWIRPQAFAHINTRQCTPVELYRLLEANNDMFISGLFRPADMLDLGTGVVTNADGKQVRIYGV